MGLKLAGLTVVPVGDGLHAEGGGDRVGERQHLALPRAEGVAAVAARVSGLVLQADDDRVLFGRLGFVERQNAGPLPVVDAADADDDGDAPF